MSRIRSAWVDAADLFSDWTWDERAVGVVAIAVLVLMSTGAI